jgi:hypothetical protein
MWMFMLRWRVSAKLSGRRQPLLERFRSTPDEWKRRVMESVGFMRGFFAALQDDGEEQATTTAGTEAVSLRE